MNINREAPFFTDNKERQSTQGQKLDPSLLDYIRYTSKFTRVDWIKYVTWVGMMIGLNVFVSTILFTGLGTGTSFPVYVWLIPISILGFTISIAFDNIAHSVIYKEWISLSEFTIHKFTTTAGIGSTVALILGYFYPQFFFIPILVLIGLSMVYSLIDEGIHWVRYSQGGSGLVEVSCHFGILLSHSIMMFTWLMWYLEGYQGVAQALSVFGL